MLWIIIIVAALFALMSFPLILQNVFEWALYADKICILESGTIIFLVSLVLCIAHLCIAFLIINNRTEENQQYTSEIVSIFVEQQDNRTFFEQIVEFFRLDTLDEAEHTYTYYYKYGENGYKKDKIVSDDVVFYEDICPRIVENSIGLKVPLWDKILTFGLYGEAKTTYEVFVPIGTITGKYNL